MFQNTPNSAIGLTINLMSFTIPSKIICETDIVRVRIQTIPDGMEQKFDIKGNKMDNCNLIFTFNISNLTEKLDISFLKRTILSGNPLIGSASLNICDIVRAPNVGSSGIKVLNIFYPIERQIQESPRSADKSSIKEKVIGQVKLAISQSEPQTTNIGSKFQKKQGKTDEQRLINISSSSENLF